MVDERRSIFDLGEAPPDEGVPGQTPLLPPGEGAGFGAPQQDAPTLFQEAVERLVAVAQISPDLAPVIAGFFDEVQRVAMSKAPPPGAAPQGPPQGGGLPPVQGVPPGFTGGGPQFGP